MYTYVMIKYLDRESLEAALFLFGSANNVVFWFFKMMSRSLVKPFKSKKLFKLVKTT
jgi:hypothetical protein